MKTLHILRGVPGSGKSTKAKEISEEYVKGLTEEIWFLDSIICSTDDYWIRKDGTYDWNPKLLNKAHDWCFQKVCNAISDEYSCIILDNTNLVRSQFQRYIDVAKENGYTIIEHIIGEFTQEAIKEYHKRCLHNVPLETIQAMARKFEK